MIRTKLSARRGRIVGSLCLPPEFSLSLSLSLSLPFNPRKRSLTITRSLAQPIFPRSPRHGYAELQSRAVEKRERGGGWRRGGEEGAGRREAAGAFYYPRFSLARCIPRVADRIPAFCGLSAAERRGEERGEGGYSGHVIGSGFRADGVFNRVGPIILLCGRRRSAWRGRLESNEN